MLTVTGLPGIGQVLAGCQRCGSNSSTWLALCVGSRVSTSLSARGWKRYFDPPVAAYARCIAIQVTETELNRRPSATIM